ncbi:MAG: bifunctional phosphoribosylaminoimidazolecarboxamide formyltransferase/IMP cyclohydrolase [Clostridiales bacterium]|jgi:phosphoribosylaminoimidazolecarboxamide formyltransferase/IMP cyclohydrolase|nr:bifunctional phosphoribosylaminoimidazolecarboxamide formyltransferase/IMP cyclohydrolase [Clostridiales bacterium]
MKRALISVSDKTGVVDLSRRLVDLGIEIISTGGTFSLLMDNDIPVTSVSDITGFPECLDGRVKTLHPAIHAGILALRDNKTHMNQIDNLNIELIDLVIVNLYPFKATIERGADFDEAVENIDIGGPTMLRAAAKNYQDVLVITDPSDYDELIQRIEEDTLDIEYRKGLMYKVFQHTAVYDTLISTYLRKELGIDFPDYLTLAYDKKEQMRYGENPHQQAALYSESLPIKNSLVNATILNGKQLSYNNINDTNGAIELLKEFPDKTTVVAVKHANPCGVACADTVYDAYMKAYEADPVSIFGGIVATNAEVDKITAEEMVKIFLEIIVAPSFTEEALEVLKTKPNLRVLQLEDVGKPNNKGSVEFKKCYGGLILQESDLNTEETYNTVTKKEATKEELETMAFAMKVVKHCKSNAIVVAKGQATLGLGIGQTNRIWATNQAIEHSKDAKGAVLASDAFFPFADCVEVAAKAGISAIVQPGGSIRDQESIDACDKAGIAMVFSGVRHFKH